MGTLREIEKKRGGGGGGGGGGGKKRLDLVGTMSISMMRVKGFLRSIDLDWCFFFPILAIFIVIAQVQTLFLTLLRSNVRHCKTVVIDTAQFNTLFLLLLHPILDIVVFVTAQF